MSLLLLALVWLAGCRPDRAPVILLSIDGFRYDYLERGVTPVLARLAAEGVSGPLIPAFPTKTFPNHYTMVTGRYPGEHGIVSNTIRDPATGDTFRLGNRVAVGEARWWGGTPVWVSAERAGIATAIMFWPGSEAPIQGVRPTTWMPYDHDTPHATRVDSVLAWVDRAGFVAWYLSDVDDAGHRFGPGAPETDSALARVDRAVGDVVEGLRARGLLERVHLVVVADHGMAPLSPDRVVRLERYVDTTGLMILDLSPFLQIWADSARLARALPALRRVPHLSVWPRDSTPPAFHYRDHPRIAPLVGLMDEGWTLVRGAPRPSWGVGGTHGFADTLPSMQALFLARGPAIAAGTTRAPFRNVEVYPLLMDLLGLDAP